MRSESTPVVVRRDIPPAWRDGYELHCAALRLGLDVTLYPRQVLQVTQPAGGPDRWFVHGVPESSTLAAVTYAQDKRMRRQLLVQAGLPVPDGVTFAIGREIGEAKRFARNVGYPVVVKPASGDNMSEVFTGVRNEKELATTIDYFRTPELGRPAFSRTAYALTLLLEPDEEDGRTITPAGYQLLVEKQVTGVPLRILVVGDRVVSAVAGPGEGRGSADRSYGEVRDEIHPDFRDLALTAVRAIPGLTTAALDLIVTDHRSPRGQQDAWIVDFSERPLLAQQAMVSDALSAELATALLRHAAPVLDDVIPRDLVSIDFRVEGATSATAVAAALGDAARDAGVTSDVTVEDDVEGSVVGVVDGPADWTAWVFESLLAGTLAEQRAMLVTERHRHGG
jgi:hypothetical protein